MSPTLTGPENNPPGRLAVRWCPACGRVQLGWSPLGGAHVGEHGGSCTTRRVPLEYHLPQPRSAYITGTASLRAVVEITATVSPALPHLPNETHGSTIVGRAYMFAAERVDQLADLLQAHAELMGAELADLVAVHPRPAPIEGWPHP